MFNDERAPLAGGTGTGHVKVYRSRRRALYLTVGLVLVAVIVLAITLPVLKHQNDTSPKNTPLAQQVKVSAIDQHLSALMQIATEHEGSRAVYLGYNASAEYVMQQLAPYNGVSINVKTVPFAMELWSQDESKNVFAQTAPESLTYTLNVDWALIRNSGAATLTNQAIKVPSGSELGCSAADYTGVSLANSIALVARGDCSFHDKGIVAQQLGASATIIYDPAENSLIAGSIIAQNGSVVNPAVLSVTSDVAMQLQQLATQNSTMFSLTASTEFNHYDTFDIVAQTTDGIPSNAIVIAAHLDSVPAGPGINDNGSGSSSVLEICLAWLRSGKTAHNAIRFAWWGAEEYGLLGSQAYVDGLKAKNVTLLDEIALNLNFDMLGSPNYFRGVYNGTGADASVVNGSSYLQGLFEAHFQSLSLPTTPTAFNGRSDYGPFIENGIPAGGLATGAEVIKTMEERTLYGGLANAAFDTCYHKVCDTLENVNREVLEQNAQAAATILETVATDPNLREHLNNKLPSELLTLDAEHTERPKRFAKRHHLGYLE